MCNLSQGIVERGIAQGMAQGVEKGAFSATLDSLRRLIANAGMSAEQAMNVLEIPASAVFKIFCKCAKRGTQRISRARGLRLRACANAATASAAWPWQVAGEMLKWGTDGRPMKVLIPGTVGTISIAFSRRSVKAGVERTLSLRPRMVNRRSACQDT